MTPDELCEVVSQFNFSLSITPFQLEIACLECRARSIVSPVNDAANYLSLIEFAVQHQCFKNKPLDESTIREELGKIADCFDFKLLPEPNLLRELKITCQSCNAIVNVSMPFNFTASMSELNCIIKKHRCTDWWGTGLPSPAHIYGTDF